MIPSPRQVFSQVGPQTGALLRVAIPKTTVHRCPIQTISSISSLQLTALETLTLAAFLRTRLTAFVSMASSWQRRRRPSQSHLSSRYSLLASWGWPLLVGLQPDVRETQVVGWISVAHPAPCCYLHPNLGEASTRREAEGTPRPLRASTKGPSSKNLQRAQRFFFVIRYSALPHVRQRQTIFRRSTSARITSIA